MSENFRLDRKIGFRNTFYTKCINVIIDSIGPSILLRSIYSWPRYRRQVNQCVLPIVYIQCYLYKRRLHIAHISQWPECEGHTHLTHN